MRSVPVREVRPRAEPGLAFAAWLALVLVLARAALLFALELSHHGDAELAVLRLAHAFAPLAVGALGLAFGAALGAWGLALAPSRLLRALVPLVFALLLLAFLWGRLGTDPSRRIGFATPLGRVALALAGLAALVLSLAFFRGRPRFLASAPLGSWRGPWPPLVALALAGLGLRQGAGGFAATMDVRRVERELVGGTWETLRAHPDGPATPGLLAPANLAASDEAARPALLLPPPAHVRRTLPPSEDPWWLVGGAALDASIGEVAERYAGDSLRLTVRLDESRVFEAVLPLAGASGWSELGSGAGLRAPGGAVLELETALLDPSGKEVEPADPLRAGFGGLALEQRTRVARASASPAQPNVVLVVIDTLRADRTSAYGYGRETTPHLAELARRGVLFEETCATASWTWPSTASILTGLLPEEHGVEDAASSFLSQGLDTLAEALQRAGFTTAAWSGSPLIVPEKFFDQGFEFFDASREQNLRRSDIVMPGALEWLGAIGERRFFLYLHLMEPHAPYVPLPEGRARFASEVPSTFDARRGLDYQWELLKRYAESGELAPERTVPPEEQRWLSDLYDGCVWSADYYVGLLLARLEELGLASDTIVAVTSDHGEELFDHGLLAHAHALHRELVRVPLVIAGPGLPAGERVSTPVSSVAIAPTLARLAGTRLAGLVDPADLFHPRADAPLLFSTRQGYWNGAGRQPLFGLRTGTSVLHFAPHGAPFGKSGDGAGEVRLYDLAQDPDERTDLAPREPERAHALREELRARLAALQSHHTETGGVVDERTRDALDGLGYVGPGEESEGEGGQDTHRPAGKDERH